MIGVNREMNLMETYSDFAEVYDYVLRHVDYDEWYRYIRSVMMKYIDMPDMILELGCGTGRFGAKFSRDDFIIFGIDRSLSMLRVAKIRAYKNFRIFCGDIRNFRLSKSFDFIFSVHDTMNYLLTKKDIRNTLRSVRSVMHRDSIFMFDITTDHNIRRFFDNKTMSYSVHNMQVEWKNRYDTEKKLIYSTLRFDKTDGTITTEEHIQRIYTADEMKELLCRERFEIIGVFSDYTFSPVKEDTVMINFVARKG